MESKENTYLSDIPLEAETEYIHLFINSVENLIQKYDMDNYLHEFFPNYKFTFASLKFIYCDALLYEEILQWAENLSLSMKIRKKVQSIPLVQKITHNFSQISQNKEKFLWINLVPSLEFPFRFSIMPERVFLEIQSKLFLQDFLALFSLPFSDPEKYNPVLQNDLFYPVCRINHQPIMVVESNLNWETEFNALSRVLWKELKDIAVKIEHCGSTSVPNLPAKPILDINIVISSQNLLPDIINRLHNLGYIYNGDQGISGREAFKYNSNQVPYTSPRREWMNHHLYVCCEDAKELKRQIYFRDFLRSHPEAMQEYGRLKRELAVRYRDNREAYTNAKSDFITNILGKIELELKS